MRNVSSMIAWQRSRGPAIGMTPINGWQREPQAVQSGHRPGLIGSLAAGAVSLCTFAKPSRPEHSGGVVRSPFLDQVRQRLAVHGSELEPEAGKAAGHGDLRMFRIR